MFVRVTVEPSREEAPLIRPVFVRTSVSYEADYESDAFNPSATDALLRLVKLGNSCVGSFSTKRGEMHQSELEVLALGFSPSPSVEAE